MRYADVLLMYAEVLNELGIPVVNGNQYYYLNLVRKRAFSANPTAYEIPDLAYTKAQFRDTLMRERRMEFAHEGQRLFDMKRTGTYISGMTALAEKTKAALAATPVPTYSGVYPAGVYPNPTGPKPTHQALLFYSRFFKKCKDNCTKTL